MCGVSVHFTLFEVSVTGENQRDPKIAAGYAERATQGLVARAPAARDRHRFTRVFRHYSLPATDSSLGRFPGRTRSLAVYFSDFICNLLNSFVTVLQ